MDNRDRDTAYISNDEDIIKFIYDNRVIRFRGPKNLIRFDSVLEWDNGYLVVEAMYSYSPEAVEDYIDLIPILDNLYIDTETFLKQIKKVEVSYV